MHSALDYMAETSSHTQCLGRLMYADQYCFLGLLRGIRPHSTVLLQGHDMFHDMFCVSFRTVRLGSFSSFWRRFGAEKIHRMSPSGGLCGASELGEETARPTLERVWRARLERVLQTVYLWLFHRRGDLRCSSHLREGEPSQRHCRSPALFLSFPSFSLSPTQRILHDRVGECRL